MDTPTEAPVAEPAMFDNDNFVERNIPSGIQLEKRFPVDPVKKTMHRDIVTERQLLEEYWQMMHPTGP